MTKHGVHMRSSSTGQFLPVEKNRAPTTKVKFGTVTVTGSKPSAASVKTNVERSTQALERVTKKLTKPGVVLPQKKDVPRFSVAEGETNVFVRKLNGRTERGRLVNGAFKVID